MNSFKPLSFFLYVFTSVEDRPDMTEKLLTGTLSLNTTNQPPWRTSDGIQYTSAKGVLIE